MPTWLNNIKELAPTVVIALGAFSWILRLWLKNYVAELKPNGGSSLNDIIKLQVLPLVTEMHEDVIELRISHANLEGKFEQHIKDGD